ncbi:hypothetical protein FGADI_4556 [Fusarium gaditjirri]|uniref:Ubiquitin-like protease family profile domain-containing protein n=1 Tax=Fusarium gaditjirri TaxID=282569 RepID=A0A8H4TCQ7_9HYPO|nr:hypothetical protein FGADI_4556 [Fusarium gaditjirri]
MASMPFFIPSASPARSIHYDLDFIIHRIIESNHEGEQLDEEMNAALSRYPTEDQQRVRIFTQTLLDTCNALLGQGQAFEQEAHDVDSKSEPGPGICHQRSITPPITQCCFSSANQEIAAVAGGSEPGLGILGQGHAFEEAPAVDGRSKADPESCLQGLQSITPPITQTGFASADQEVAVVDGGSEPGLDSCYAGFQSLTPPSTRCCFSPPDQEAGDDADVNGRDSVQTATSPNTQSPLREDEALHSMAESTPEPSPKTPSNSYCHRLIDQTIGDFIHETYEMLERFSFNDLSLETNKTVLESIKCRLDHSHSLDQGQHHDISWSDGSQYVSLMDSGKGSRYKGSLFSALSIMDFTGWHSSQVQLLENKMHSGYTAQDAAQAVTARVIRCKLGCKDESNRKDWERCRKRLNTDLARGRKWLYLSAKLGCGILFKDVWNLAKSSQSELNELTLGLPRDPEKAALLRLLDEQMDSFLETGKTNLTVLRERLEAKGLAFAIPPLPRSATGLNNDIYTQFRGRLRSNDLVIKGTDFKFSTESLKSLGDKTWLSSDIVTACLHLSHRLPFVNTGFYVPTHRQEKPLGLLPRPFQKANKQMKMWAEEYKENGLVVGLFPLLLTNNHFTLLEINERTGHIYHYDSLCQKHSALQSACQKEFPHLNYIEKVDRLGFPKSSSG